MPRPPSAASAPLAPGAPALALGDDESLLRVAAHAMRTTTMPITTIAVHGVSPGLGFGCSGLLAARGLFFTAPVEAARARL